MVCGVWKSVKDVIRLISVEPTMVLYMMAFMITSVVEQQFYIYKACTVNNNFSEAICNNLTADENKDYNVKVQVTVSEFHQWNDIAGHVVPIILALFMGAWSDKRGRKLPLIMGLIGKFYFSTMIVVNTLQKTWPVEYVIYTATLPMAFTGADVAIFAAAFSYLSDVTTPESRTLRVTILEVFYLATMPTGIALGKVLFSKITNQSYTIMFAINASLLLLSIIYSLIFLKWRTSNTQRSIFEAKNIILDFFDLNHVVETGKTIVKWRPTNRRTYLILLIISMCFYTFQRDEKHMSYLYFQLVLSWTFDQISNFRTYQSALQDVVLLTAIPFLSTFLEWRDTSIMILGSICHSIARVFFAESYDAWLIYFGGAFGAFGPIVAPIIRSMVSKLVATTERGKAFSILSVMDNATPLVSGVAYNQVYKNTISTAPAAIFYLTIGTQMFVLLIALYIHCRASREDLSHRDDPYINSQEEDLSHRDDPYINSQEEEIQNE